MTIRPNYRDRSRGVSIIHDPPVCLAAWEQRGKARNSDDAVYLAHIIGHMAGAEAEMVLLSLQTIGDRSDREQIELAARELTGSRRNCWDRLEPRLRAMTGCWCGGTAAHIERVAEALLTKTELSAKQVDKLAGCSVDDVKVNAPSLLAMRRASDAARSGKSGFCQLSVAARNPRANVCIDVCTAETDEFGYEAK